MLAAPVQPFRDDTPTPDRVRAVLQEALHPISDDLVAAFAGPDRWFERALAKVERPSLLEPLARRAFQRARERVVAEPPQIETSTLVACPVWSCHAEDDIHEIWDLVWCLLGRSEALPSLTTASEPQPLAVVAEARITVAWVHSMALSRFYAPGIPSVERFEPFVVVRHPVVRVDEVTQVRTVELAPPPNRGVGPWDSDAEAAFDVSLLTKDDRDRLVDVLKRSRG